MAHLADLNGTPCDDTTNQWQKVWPATVELTIASSGAVTITCAPAPSATVTVTWNNRDAAFNVYNADDDPSDGRSPYRQCFAGVQAGPTFTCSIPVPQGARVELSASPPFGGSMQSWGGACAGVGSIAFRQCVLVVNANTSVSATFSS